MKTKSNFFVNLFKKKKPQITDKDISDFKLSLKEEYKKKYSFGDAFLDNKNIIFITANRLQDSILCIAYNKEEDEMQYMGFNEDKVMEYLRKNIEKNK